MTMKSSTKPTALLALLVALLAACSEKPLPIAPPATSAPYLVAVNSPLQYFAERLLDETVEVQLLVPAGTDPAQWEPSVEDVLQLQGAELVLLNGAGYSRWLDKVTLGSNKLVVTSGPARKQWIELEGQVTHSHGPGDEHAHGGYAFTTWMDMSLAQVQARAVADALIKHWPQKQATVTGNLDGLIDDIEALDAGYREQATRLADRQIIYSHPVYQYFERRYNLPGHSLHWEPGVMPTEAQWQELEQLRSGNSLFVWEGAPEDNIAKRMAAMGIAFVVIDPGANTGEHDWLTVQRNNLERLRSVN
jgi:zinc transport system substrate-binding protein